MCGTSRGVGGWGVDSVMKEEEREKKSSDRLSLRGIADFFSLFFFLFRSPPLL